jgi:hypothetical protein
MLAGAWHGGEAVYRYGTGVATAAETAAGEATGLRYFVPPLQLHALVAGLALASVLGAVGLTLRRWEKLQAPATAEKPWRAGPLPPDTPSASGNVHPGPAEARNIAPVCARLQPPSRPARFWLLAVVLGAGAALAGLWSTMGEFSGPAWQANAGMLAEEGHLRLLLHLIVGLVIPGLTLALVLVSRFTRRAPRSTGILMGLLILMTAAQLWLGVLMLFDSHNGPLTGFRTTTAATEPPHEHEPGHEH